MNNPTIIRFHDKDMVSVDENNKPSLLKGLTRKEIAGALLYAVRRIEALERIAFPASTQEDRYFTAGDSELNRHGR